MSHTVLVLKDPEAPLLFICWGANYCHKMMGLTGYSVEVTSGTTLGWQDHLCHFLYPSGDSWHQFHHTGRCLKFGTRNLQPGIMSSPDHHIMHPTLPTNWYVDYSHLLDTEDFGLTCLDLDYQWRYHYRLPGATHHSLNCSWLPTTFITANKVERSRSQTPADSNKGKCQQW